MRDSRDIRVMRSHVRRSIRRAQDELSRCSHSGDRMQQIQKRLAALRARLARLEQVRP